MYDIGVLEVMLVKRRSIAKGLEEERSSREGSIEEREYMMGESKLKRYKVHPFSLRNQRSTSPNMSPERTRALLHLVRQGPSSPLAHFRFLLLSCTMGLMHKHPYFTVPKGINPKADEWNRKLLMVSVSLSNDFPS